VLTLSVKNFGPIREGAVKLRPLTILIGPNNAGKSYLGTAAYALWKAFERAYWFPPVPSTSRKLSNPERERLDKFVNDFVERMPHALANELQRCFGASLEELVRAGASQPLSFTVQQDRPFFNLEFRETGNQLRLRTKTRDLPELPFDRSGASDWLPRDLDFSYRLIRDLFPFLSSTAFYLPAARSGILQGHKALASSLLERLPLVGIERFDIPRLSGVVADFISNLLRLEPRRRRTHSFPVVQFLEEKLCKGSLEISARDSKFLYPEIHYQQKQTGARSLPLHRTSSMISEVAPVILFIKYLIKPNDFMILEEPEAHLHPDNQRLMARVVARLVRDGVRVLITTHSDYFVHQVSNLVRMKTIPTLREKMGYDERECLAVEDLGAYLFRLPDAAEGSVIEELSVTAEDGIPEAEFIRIAEEISEETARLSLG
jgi:predicted ATPase